MRLAEQTGQTSTAVATRPMLDAVEADYWQAFQVLHTTRVNTGFGPSPIALREIESYAELVDMPRGEPRHDLLHLIKAMDRAYLEQVMKK